jgi:hypothetical protein
VHTWRGVRVVRRECHGGLEVTAIVQGVRVDHDQCDIPVEDVVIVQLCEACQSCRSVTLEESGMLTWTWTHFSLRRALNSFMRMRSAMATVRDKPGVGDDDLGKRRLVAVGENQALYRYRMRQAACGGIAGISGLILDQAWWSGSRKLSGGGQRGQRCLELPMKMPENFGGNSD